MDGDHADRLTDVDALCPRCGSKKTIRIAYGFPTPEMMEAHERDEIVLGGCLIFEDAPTVRCRACGHQWGAPPQRIDGVAAYFPGR